MNNRLNLHLNITKSFTSLIDNVSYNINTFYKHLRQHNLTTKDYVETYITGYTPLCSCGNPLVFYQNRWRYAKSCGSHSCVGKQVSNTISNWSQEQREENSKNKSNASKNMSTETRKKAKEKTIVTSMKNHGVPYPGQSKIQKEKSKATKLARYGNEYYNNSEKSAKTNRSKTNKQQIEINKKRENTNILKFGVPTPLIQPCVLSKSKKSNAKSKPYTLLSGRVVYIRGFENLALDELLKIYSEDEILMHDWNSKYSIPIFEYVNTKNRKSKYYPDFYIPKDNLIIEIKSEWWWSGLGDKKYKSRLQNNLYKKQAVTDNGYKYEVWVYNTQKNKKVLQ